MTMLAELEGLEEVAEDVYVRYLLTLGDAIDLFIETQPLAPKTAYRYGGTLDRFAETLPVRADVAKVTEEDILRFLAKYRHLSRGTQAHLESHLASFFKWLYRSRRIKTNPMEFVPRTRRPDPDSLDLVTVSSSEVVRMLAAAETWAEKICLGVLAYLGPRRHAVALLRLSDYDRERGRLRFHEKGGKTIWKPVPDALNVLLEAALAAGVYQDGVGGVTPRAEVRDVRPSADPYLVPPEGPLARHGERDDRVIWRLVKRVADRAGVNCHVHALRAAFADFYLDSGGDGKALQLLLGHKSPATTERYTRRFDRERRMDSVRSLSWGDVK